MSAPNSSNVPALAPPPGTKSNFVNPYSLSNAFVATAVFCLLFATVSLIIRASTSLRVGNRKFRVEEYACIVSWMGLVLTIVMTFPEIQKGLGRHQWDVLQSDITPLSKLFYINRIFYSPTILAAKLTILLQLMRIFTPIKCGLEYRLIQSLMAFNVCFYTANVLSIIFQCNPIQKAWVASIPGTCLNTNLNLVVTGAMNVVSDILILILPLWSIWHLKLSIRKKLGVSVVFGAGIFANVAGIMRLAYSIWIINGADLTYLRLQHAMWTIAEITTAILCSTLPLVPQFIGLFRTRRPSVGMRSSYHMSNSKSNGRSESASSLRNGSSSTRALSAWDDGGERGIKTDKQIAMEGFYTTSDDEMEVEDQQRVRGGGAGDRVRRPPGAQLRR